VVGRPVKPARSRFCRCETPVRATDRDGIAYCETCEELLPDSRDELPAAVARGVAKMSRQLERPRAEPEHRSPDPGASELVDEIVERTAKLVLERIGRPADDDGWLRGAQAIADYIGSPRSRVYALANCTPPRIPVEHDGSALVAKRSVLDGWVANGGGKRP
jgi:hypothetical protein